MPYEEGSDQKDWFQLMGGHFVTRTDPKDPKAVTRELTAGANKGKTVYERRFKSIKGYLTEIKRTQKEFGDGKKSAFWEFHFDDLEKQFCLSLGYHSGWARSILFRLPNLKLNEMIELKAIYFSADNSSAIAVVQENNPNTNPETGTINRHWTKESKDLPALVEADGFSDEKFTKESQNKQLEFIWKYIEKEVNPNTSAGIPSSAPTQAQQKTPFDDPGTKEEAEKEAPAGNNDEEDTLPF